MEKAEIKDGHLYLTYQYFDIVPMQHRNGEDIVPVDRIMALIYHVGPRGGDHGWSIQSNENKTLADFGKKHTSMRDQVIKIFAERNILVQKIQSTGSGPCY